MNDTNRSLFLIGNGFDLAHNLKTSYSDFILWYLNNCISILNERKSNRKYSDPLVTIIRRHTSEIEQINSIEEFINYIKAELIKFKIVSILFERIISQAKQYRWVDIESIYYKCLSEIAFDDEINDKEVLILELNNGLNFLKDKLKNYLLEIYDNEIRIDTNIESHIQKILFDSDFKSLTLSTAYFLNFNYTSTINNYINNVISTKYNIEIINIHGQITENDSLIFGYGDEMDLNYEKIEHKNNNEYLKHFKSFGYFKNTRLSKLLSFIEADSFNVYIMGHSCGISDRLLLNTIFQHDNCKSIKIFYHKIDEFKNDFVEKTMEISRSFTLEGKAKMRKRIVPFNNCKPLT